VKAGRLNLISKIEACRCPLTGRCPLFISLRTTKITQMRRFERVSTSISVGEFEDKECGTKMDYDCACTNCPYVAEAF
jgi:hypothetical protein